MRLFTCAHKFPAMHAQVGFVDVQVSPMSLEHQEGIGRGSHGLLCKDCNYVTGELEVSRVLSFWAQHFYETLCFSAPTGAIFFKFALEVLFEVCVFRPIIAVKITFFRLKSQ